jgi:hypothetical protein
MEEHEDDEEHDGENDLEAFLSSLSEFVFPGPFVGVPRLQVEHLTGEVVRCPGETAIVFRIEIDRDVTGQGSVRWQQNLMNKLN